MAQARKLDAEAVKTILSVLRAGRGITTAARLAQVSRQAIYKRMASSKTFRDAIEEAKTLAYESLEGAFFDAAVGNPPGPGKNPPNVVAAMALIKRHDEVGQGKRTEGVTLAQLIARADKIEDEKTNLRPESSP